MVLSGAAGIRKLQRTKGKKECGILHKLRIVFYGYKVRGKQEPVCSRGLVTPTFIHSATHFTNAISTYCVLGIMLDPGDTEMRW